VKIVKLDQVCRQQQLAEGWCHSFEQVPERAPSRFRRYLGCPS
jgi:hypothetical protein